MTLLSPGQRRVNLLKTINERGYIRVLENSDRFKALMGLAELGEVSHERGSLAGVHWSFTFRLTPNGEHALRKRLEND